MSDSHTPAGAAGAPSSGLYAFAECDMVDMKNGTVLLLDRDSGQQLLVAPPVAQSMRMCRSFRTLEEHTGILTTSVPELAGQQADVMGVLGMLRDAGFMTSAESACARLNAAQAAPVDLPATRVFVITCDRPAAVERLLESMLRTGKLSRHDALYLIDDSRDAGNAQANQAAVEKFNLTSARDMHYFGAEQTRQFMQSLIAANPAAEEAIRFLIDRERWSGAKTYGLARNLCLLLSVGYRAIVLDDDVLCSAHAAPHSAEGMQFGSTTREVEFYRDAQEALARNPVLDFDPLSGHAQCLGLSLGQAVARLELGPVTPQQLHGSSSALLRQWSADSPLLVTQNGTLGDPGSQGTEWLFELQGESARRMAAYPGGIQGALASRSYWLGYPHPGFTKMAVMSQVTGLDNSRLLPPYFPAFRGEDYLFGAMTEYLHPESAVLTYPWCVPHLPLDARPANPDPAPRDGRPEVNFGKCVTDRTVYRAGISPEARLHSLAALVGECAETVDVDLAIMFRREAAELQADDMLLYQRLLQDGMLRPPQWQEWLQDSLQSVQAASQQAAAPGALRNLPQPIDDTEALARFREFASGMAAALAHWPGIRAAAVAAGSAAEPGATVG
ncbi:hypothetical protein E4634_13145 [Mangrovimicrobium sediminis]|uniref:Uncharacterized protein n=1 Tax=Mangrovimicrobium sediminis TaxID=2562682 RepID=A0A4Z0LZ27_9GAMM|nr:hypothetical protein [Haliea sp. SAOS-164]TGD72474.1 hypothetical protein E4634_13145 [Haliea sp. SAOS-164]